jgi:TolB-like protein/Flp pilus assembly protein TadD
MTFGQFVVELKRRNVYRAAVAYAMTAWLLAQIATQIFPFFGISNVAVRFMIIALVVGFPIAVLLAWLYEFTPEGIMRTTDLDPATARVGRRTTGRVLDFIIIGVLLLIIGLLIMGRRDTRDSTAPASDAKSIAVLPFVSLSADPNNAFFADAVQDEILTDLAKLADLKVISRMSVMHYNSGGRNLRDIAAQLGVRYILEGTVQSTANRIRVTAQLIDAPSDSHLWAEHFDGSLEDVFAIQTDIAEKIATELHARLSPSEKAAIERPRTSDLTAFELYTRAKTLLLTEEDLHKAIDLLDQAVARDPGFFSAYCELAHAHGRLYVTWGDHTTTRVALADAAVQNALRLEGDSGAAHLALAENFYQCHFEYDKARAELDAARASLPNNARVLALTGLIDRRQGRWEAALDNLEKAVALDPKNFEFLRHLSLSYRAFRRFPEMAAVLDRALALIPNDIDTKLYRANLDFECHGDLKPTRELIQSVPTQGEATASPVAWAAFWLAYYEHDLAASETALTRLDGQTASTRVTKLFYEGCLGRMQRNDKKARGAFESARTQQVNIVQIRPNDAVELGLLGQIDAALGRNQDAVREGRAAVEMVPNTKDAIVAGLAAQYLAVISAWSGEKDLAFEQLENLARSPNLAPTSYGDLKLNPLWDPLRNDARFPALLAEFQKPVPPG